MVSKDVLHYREIQLDKISNFYCRFKPKIKIINNKPNGTTNWLEISESELIKIKNILLGEEN